MIRPGAAEVLLLIACALLIVHGLSLGAVPQDDAFISFRYAANLVEGEGLVYNPGERVEGFTNFLWTAGMAPLIAAGVDPVNGCRAAGLLCALGTLFVVYRGARVPLALSGVVGSKAQKGYQVSQVGQVGQVGWIGAGAALILAASSSFAGEAVMGLETSLFALLVTATLLRTEREEVEGGNGLVPGLLGGLAALTRPEGTLVLVGAAVHRILPSPFGGAGGRPSGERWKSAILSVSACLAIAIPHRLLSRLYYGSWLPNTFHAKVGGGWDAVSRGAGYAGDFVVSWLPVIILAAIGFVALGRSRATLRAVFILGYVFYVIGVGGDYKLTLRFFQPVMPLLALTAAEGIGVLVRLADRPAARRAVACSLAGICVAVVFLLSEPAREYADFRRFKYETDRLAGEWFARHAEPDWMIATSNAGTTPYFSGLRTIDMLGLADAHIARIEMPGMGRGVAGHEKGDGDYVLSRRPEIILFMQTRISADGPVSRADAGGAINFVGEAQLWQNPEFHQEYEWLSVPLSGYTLNFFARRDVSPRFSDVRWPSSERAAPRETPAPDPGPTSY